MFFINKDKILTVEVISKIINSFMINDLPRLNKLKNYYDGKQNILNKQPVDIDRPNNKVVVNYAYDIVENYTGYISGIPITYSNDDFEDVQEVLNYNDVHYEDKSFLKSALKYGVGCEINYIDEDGKIRFKELDPRTTIPVYSDNLNQDLLYAIRFWSVNEWDNESTEYWVEVYSATTITKYRSNEGFSSLTFISEEPHYYGQCPITFFNLNKDKVSIFEQIVSLCDAYNTLLSCEVDDWEAFCDAYMVLTGCTADDEDLKEMKKNRVIILDEGEDAKYLTKQSNDNHIANMLSNIEDKIHKISHSPDFSNESFGTSSGIALKMKILAFENQAAEIESSMKLALQRRIELICAILKLTNEEKTWRDVKITFTRNLPVDILSIAQEVSQLTGIVSKTTLLSQIPFIEDVNRELELLEEEKLANIQLYNFETPLGNNNDEEE